MIVKFLGTHNAESKNTRLVSLLVDGIVAVDAGSLASELTFPEQKKVKAILLSHGHYDHIRAVPAFAFNNPDRTTKIIATPRTLEILSSHLIDGVLYPEFAGDVPFLEKAPLKLVPLKPSGRLTVAGYTVVAVPVPHPLDAVGFEITAGDGKSLFYTGDTGPGLSSIWSNISPQLIIADLTWPNRLAAAARDAGHLCPQMFREELIALRRNKGRLPRVAAIHLSPRHESEIEEEIRVVAKALGISIEIPHEGDELVL